MSSFWFLNFLCIFASQLTWSVYARDIYQAELAHLYNCRIRKKHKGYTGSGYVDYGRRGSFVEWNIDAPVSSEYEITVRYSSKSERPADMFLDKRSKAASSFQFSKTGGWKDWDTESIILPLKKGAHTLKLKAGDRGGPNVDWLSVNPLKPLSPAPTIKRTSKPSETPTLRPTSKPSKALTIKPTSKPSRTPTLRPTSKPSKPSTIKPTSKPSGVDWSKVTVVLEPGEYMSINESFFSPSDEYWVGLNGKGTFLMKNKRGRTLWSAGIAGGFRVYMQHDGNLIVRDYDNSALWSSNTSKNRGAKFAIHDDGQVLILYHGTVIWMDGIPGGEYTGPSSNDLTFPIRGIFYYPWFPETWTVNGKLAKFEPALGYYSSGDSRVAEAHVDALDYAHIDLSISSWWGPDSNLDRSRMTLLMDKTVANESPMKWTVYYEDERDEDSPPDKIRNDLDYLKKWFAWHPAWAHIDGRPVIFVYNEVGCEVVDRWMEASNGDWYVVVKLFKGFRDCPVQPDSWHQYGPADSVVQIKNHSFSISPGFWRADMKEPLLPRVSKEDFCANTKLMVSSNDPWQLITTFNEAGEGTMVEASHHWASDTEYGFYLDCLHDYH